MTNLNFISRDEKAEFKKLFTRNYPLSHLVFQLKATSSYWKKIFKTQTCFSEVLRMINHEDGKTDTYFIVKTYHKLLDEIKEKINSDPSYFSYILKQIKEILEESEELAKNKSSYLQKISKETPKEFLEAFSDYWDICYKITAVSWGFDVIGEALIENFIEKTSIQDQEKIQIILSKGMLTIFLKEKLKFLELMIKLKGAEKEEVEKALTAHLNEWDYIGMETPIARPFTLEDFNKRYQELKDREIFNEIRKIEETIISERLEFKKVLEELNLSQEALTALSQAREFIRMKNNERITFQKDIFSSLDIFNKTLEILGFAKDSSYILENEIFDLINQLIKIDSRKNKEHLVYLNKGEVSISEYIETQEKTNQEIKGLTASKGHVKGKVKLIESIEQASSFQRGDILVTSMTTPDFLPIMEKSIAIITDEGGIMSHAAIVSREFNVPCIVGTENATKILKDGMLVEVNALSREGFVKILEEK